MKSSKTSRTTGPARLTPMALLLGVPLFTAAALAVHRAAGVAWGEAFAIMTLGWFSVILTMCLCELLREWQGEEEPGAGSSGGARPEVGALHRVLAQAASGDRQDLFNGPRQLLCAAVLAVGGFAIDRAFPLQMHAFSLHVLLLTTGWMTGTGVLILQHQLSRRTRAPAAAPVESDQERG